MEKNPDFEALKSEIEPMLARIKESGGDIKIDAKLDGQFTIFSVVPSYPRRYRIRRENQGS